MKLRTLLTGGCAALLLSLPMMASTASDTRATFEDIQYEAHDALAHAGQLQTFVRDQQIGWDIQSQQLTAIKEDINRIETQISRLEATRSSDAPLQQAAIDGMARTARLLVDNTQDAILFGNGHQIDLWLAPYRRYTDNLYNEAHALSESVDQALNGF
jgi:hypothetical protein